MKTERRSRNSCNMESAPTASTPSGSQQASINKTPVLPPIQPSSPNRGENKPLESPPKPDELMVAAITDKNVEVIVEKKISVIQYLLEAKDVVEHAKKYEPYFRALVHGSEPSVTPDPKDRLRLVNALADNGHFRLLTSYWEKLNFNDTGQWAQSAVSNTVLIRFLNLFYMMLPMWNGTDLGDDAFSRKFDESLRSFYLMLLDRDVFSTFVKVEIQSLLICALLGTLHNLVHRYSVGSSQVRDSDGVRIISKYTSHPDLLIKTKAVLVMCYIVNEREKSKLEIAEDNIKYIVAVLKDCVEAPDHCSAEHGYDAEEILDGLNQMAVADSNKEAIVKCGALPLYAALLKDGCKATEQKGACKGLWTLAFNAENKRQILAHDGCMEGLRKLCTSSDESVKREAEGALWEIEGERKRAKQTLVNTATTASNDPERSSERQVGHLMLSYNWGVQAEVLKIRDRLKTMGYKVWIDVEQMTGSTLDAMANAIEEASLVLIFFTEQYKMSPSCRSEAEYCYKMQRPFIPVRMQRKYTADGWLGLILGSKLFFDLTKPETYDITFEKFCKEIDSVINPKSVTGNIAKAAATQLQAARPHETAGSFDEPDSRRPFEIATLACRSWTEDDVGEWLRQNGLENCCDKFRGFTGIHIAELYHAFTVAPGYFYKVTQRELGLPLRESLIFTKMIRELN